VEIISGVLKASALKSALGLEPSVGNGVIGVRGPNVPGIVVVAHNTLNRRMTN
jgi:hypothetical protein